MGASRTVQTFIYADETFITCVTFPFQVLHKYQRSPHGTEVSVCRLVIREILHLRRIFSPLLAGFLVEGVIFHICRDVFAFQKFVIFFAAISCIGNEVLGNPAAHPRLDLSDVVFQRRCVARFLMNDLPDKSPKLESSGKIQERDSHTGNNRGKIMNTRFNDIG